MKKIIYGLILILVVVMSGCTVRKSGEAINIIRRYGTKCEYNEDCHWLGPDDTWDDLAGLQCTLECRVNCDREGCDKEGKKCWSTGKFLCGGTHCLDYGTPCVPSTPRSSLTPNEMVTVLRQMVTPGITGSAFDMTPE